MILKAVLPDRGPSIALAVGLTSAIAPNVGDSGALFLSVGSLRTRSPPDNQKPNNRPVSSRPRFRR